MICVGLFLQGLQPAQVSGDCGQVLILWPGDEAHCWHTLLSMQVQDSAQ
jgi:hypothetical protein